MENCKDYSELLSAFVDNELSSEEAELVQKHIASCPECRAHLSILKKIHTESAELTQEVPEGFSSQVMQAIAASEKSEKRFFLARFKFTAVAAAIILLVFAAGKLDSFAPRLEENSSDAAVTENRADADAPLVPATLSPMYDAVESKPDAADVPAKQETQPAVEKARGSNTANNQAKKPVQRQEEFKSTVSSSAPVVESAAPPVISDAETEDNSSAATDNSEPPIDDMPIETGGGSTASGGDMTADTSADAGASDSSSDEAVPDSATEEVSEEETTSTSAPPMPKVPQAETYAFYIVVDAEAALSLFSDYPSNIFEGNYLISFEKGKKADVVAALKAAELSYYEYGGDADAVNALIIIVP